MIRLVSMGLLVLNCIIAPGVHAAGQTPQTFRLESVQASGLHRYAQPDLLTLGGVKLGQTISVGDLDALVRRLSATGLFSNIQYVYNTTAQAMNVTLTLEEAPLTVPVVFDNFVWMTDDELLAALHQDVPKFDGLGGDSLEFTTFLQGALQHVIDVKHIEGRVQFTPRLNLQTKKQTYVFAVNSPSPLLKTCAMTITGSNAVRADDITAAGEPLVGQPYSRSLVQALEQGSWTRLYHNRGHLKVAFGPPVATLRPDCTGVSVSVQVQEGPAYSWDHATWSGLSALTQETLEPVLAMKRAELADESRIDNGILAVKTAYTKRGYLTSHATAGPEQFDDAAHTVVFHIVVQEGPQFRMGTIAVSGVPDKQAADLVKKWKLRAGDPYDGTCLGEFISTEIRPLQSRGALPPKVERTEKATGNQIDVALSFQ